MIENELTKKYSFLLNKHIWFQRLKVHQFSKERRKAKPPPWTGWHSFSRSWTLFQWMAIPESKHHLLQKSCWHYYLCRLDSIPKIPMRTPHDANLFLEWPLKTTKIIWWTCQNNAFPEPLALWTRDSDQSHLHLSGVGEWLLQQQKEER